MASLTIKSIPDPLMEQLRQSAKQHHRSLNSEVIRRLERSLGATQVDPEAFLARIQALRTRAPVPPLTDALLEEAKEESRP